MLQANCKQPLASIGSEVGLSAPAVMDRIQVDYKTTDRLASALAKFSDFVQAETRSSALITASPTGD